MSKSKTTNPRNLPPLPFTDEFVEIGRGDYCYVRSAWDGSPHVVFRFSTPTEAHAATAKGMELDHIKGAPPELVHAVMRAARAALE